MNEMTRRDFVGLAGAAVGGLYAGCRMPPGLRDAQAAFTWGCLLHLGSNMWDDFDGKGPDGWAKSEEEEKSNPNPVGPSGKRRSSYHSYLRCHEDLWTRSVDHAAEKGLNLVFVDLGEGIEYPSHPELKVVGTWSVGKIRKELARMRALGLEPVPKLNFSACHDSWLKEYHRMLSTRKYYQVVADVIRDVAEIFDRPRYFHIGYDEEMPIAEFNHFHVTVRQGELWWHDLNYTIDQVTRCGCRPVMWADAIWTGRDEYVRRMSRDVLQSNWYYRSDFSDRKLKWNYEFEKKGGWGETVNGAAAFLALEEAGFDQLPCCSNWAEEACAEALVRFCRERIDPSRLKGFYTAPWAMSVPDRIAAKGGNHEGESVGGVNFTCRGIDLLAAARDATKW